MDGFSGGLNVVEGQQLYVGARIVVWNVVGGSDNDGDNERFLRGSECC